MLNRGNYSARVELDNIKISDGETELTMTAGEAEQASAAVASVMKMSSFRAFPSHVSFDKFRINFVEDGEDLVCQLVKRSAIDVGCKFTFSTGDDLIAVLQMGKDTCVDQGRIRGGPRVGLPGWTTPEPIID